MAAVREPASLNEALSMVGVAAWNRLPDVDEARASF